MRKSPGAGRIFASILWSSVSLRRGGFFGSEFCPGDISPDADAATCDGGAARRPRDPKALPLVTLTVELEAGGAAVLGVATGRAVDKRRVLVLNFTARRISALVEREVRLDLVNLDSVAVHHQAPITDRRPCVERRQP